MNKGNTSRAGQREKLPAVKVGRAWKANREAVRAMVGAEEESED